MPDLTCYRLKDQGSGSVDDIDAALDPDRLEDVDIWGPTQIGSATGKLWVARSSPHDPEWARLLREGFGEDLSIPSVGGASAVLIIQTPRDAGAERLAFTFGQGRFLLRRDAYERGFGLKVALNVTFEGDTGEDDIDPDRLRSVDSKRVGQNILRARHQVAEAGSLEALDIDSRRELLRGVTGIPIDQETWGSRITGADAVGVLLRGGFSELEALCQRVLDAYERTDYQVRFEFVDDLKAVTDPVLLTLLEEEVLGMVVGGGNEGLDLAPPEVIDWGRVSEFQYHSESRKGLRRRELRLVDYLGSLSEQQRGSLSRDGLRRNVIKALSHDGQTVETWSVWSCLFGEVSYEGRTYVLDDGEFFEISDSILGSLDEDLSQVPEFTGTMPDWEGRVTEAEYNARAAESDPGYLLLDKRTVRMARQTSAVEICDLLSDGRSWIHVKRRTDGSKGLSHLFWQGFVSATLLLAEINFRKAALEKITIAERERADREDDHSFIGRFQIVDEGTVSASDHEVVFAILGDWGSDGLLGLPFFSKLTLRETVSGLRERGLRVSVKMVPAA